MRLQCCAGPACGLRPTVQQAECRCTGRQSGGGRCRRARQRPGRWRAHRCLSLPPVAPLPTYSAPAPPPPSHPRSMAEVQAQLDQMSDRARERAVSIAEAVRAAGEGDADLMTRLQHQQDDQLQVGGVADARAVSCWPVRAAPHPTAARQLVCLHWQAAWECRSAHLVPPSKPTSADQANLVVEQRPCSCLQADTPSACCGPAASSGGREHVGAHPGHLHAGAQLGVQTGIENLEALQASKPLKATARCHLLPAPLGPSPWSFQRICATA